MVRGQLWEVRLGSEAFVSGPAWPLLPYRVIPTLYKLLVISDSIFWTHQPGYGPPMKQVAALLALLPGLPSTFP